MNVFSHYCLTFSANDCLFSLNEIQKVYIQVLSAGVFRILHDNHCDEWSSKKYILLCCHSIDASEIIHLIPNDIASPCS